MVAGERILCRRKKAARANKSRATANRLARLPEASPNSLQLPISPDRFGEWQFAHDS